MGTIDVLTSRCSAIQSDITFLQKEISFLLKILGNCYSTSIHSEQLKLQDSYWKDFEEQKRNLDLLYAQIEKEKLILADLYLEEVINAQTLHEKLAQLKNRFDDSYNDLRMLKELFYLFMNGCNACTLRAAC